MDHPVISVRSPLGIICIGIEGPDRCLCPYTAFIMNGKFPSVLVEYQFKLLPFSVEIEHVFKEVRVGVEETFSRFPDKNSLGRIAVDKIV